MGSSLLYILKMNTLSKLNSNGLHPDRRFYVSSAIIPLWAAAVSISSECEDRYIFCSLQINATAHPTLSVISQAPDTFLT